ncbi:MAG: hypothetical protein A3F72_04380 [Bacteroidetes bacterium RIFCSPLOWO2_12_FULL_35_15]|nr:MAG: hypothetical protein A3F72_04380 [Bacteroidetes bacterium RIFCSPLOWO2_12_FULL_35_15]
MNLIISKVIGVIIALFALLTLFMSASVIFDLFGIRAKEGNYVLFVVLANFVCGVIYLVAAYGFFTQKRWTTLILVVAVVILIITFLGLLLHIKSGGIYEPKTVKAMLFRISMTTAFIALSWYYGKRKIIFNKKKS